MTSSGSSHSGSSSSSSISGCDSIDGVMAVTRENIVGGYIFVISITMLSK